MTQQQILELAASEGFYAAMIEPEQVPVDAKFRVFCEENRCGKYNANYSCPPDCGTVEELHQKILAEDKIMVLQTLWKIDGYEDKQTIMNAKKSHNAAALRLMEKIRPQKYVTTSISPMAAWLLARENEIKTVRVILSGKKNQLADEAIRERLREMYV